MGMNYHMRAKNKAVELEYKKSGKTLYLNRLFSGFILGKETWGEDCEYNQIEKIYEIELSPLRTFNYGGLELYGEEIHGWKEWELSKVSKQEDIDKVNLESQEKLKKAIEQDKYNFENNWIETKLVEQTIKELISKIKEQPEKLEELDFHYLEPENFEMNRDQQKGGYYILNDLEHIIDFIEFLESKDEHLISFYEGY